MSATSIENGKRIAFDHPSAAGLGGLVSSNGRTTFAYPSKSGIPYPNGGSEIELDGSRFRVTSSAETRKPRMVELGLLLLD